MQVRPNKKYQNKKCMFQLVVRLLFADCFSRHINWRIRLSATLQSTSRSQNYNKIYMSLSKICRYLYLCFTVLVEITFLELWQMIARIEQDGYCS